MKILNIAAPILICTTVLAGCASARVPSTAKFLDETTGQNGRACIDLHDIQSYGVLDGNIISINSLHNEYFLATVLPGCNDLQTSIGTLFHGDFRELCGHSPRNGVVTSGGDHCAINKIYRFENREQAFATYKEARQKREQFKNGKPAG